MQLSKVLKLSLVLALAAVSIFALSACTKPDAPANTGADDNGNAVSELSGSLAIEGSDTLVNLSQAWAETFMEENPGVAITVKGGGSGTGIASLLNGTIDFANASRDVKAEEFEAAKADGMELVEHAVALDGIAVIVNKANDVQDISTDDLGKIYRGEITDWSEVGGKPGKIVILGRDTSSGTYEFFLEAVVGKKNKYATSMLNLQSNQAIVDEVKKNPAAIGYVGMGYEDPAVTMIKIDGIEPVADKVRDGSYPLSRELYMVSATKVEGLAQSYLEWILSGSGQQIVTDEGFVALD